MANDIEYEPHECHYEGPCLGTCPACEAEVRYLERQLGLRHQLGRVVTLLGVSAGLFSACTQSATKVITDNAKTLGGDLVCPDTTHERMVVGKVAVPEQSDTANFIEEQHARKSGKVSKRDEMVVEPQTLDTNKLYGIVEQMPIFPGGDRKLMEYLEKNVQYPPEFEERCIQGRVIVTFVVERDGSIRNAKVIKSLDPLLDAEALRVIETMPKWIPARYNGIETAVKYTLPVIFRLK